MSLDGKESFPSLSSKTSDRPLGLGTNSPRRSGSTGKYNIKINTSAALARPHLQTTFGEPTIMENSRPDSRMRIRRRSSKGSVQSPLQTEELSDSGPHVNDHGKKDESVSNVTGHYPAKAPPGRHAYITPISPPFSLYGLSPTSQADPYEDVFDALNRQGHTTGNRIKIDTGMLHSHTSYHPPDTSQSLFSLQSPASSAGTYYSPLSPRGHISSPGGVTPWRRGSMIPTVPELESDQPDCGQEARGRSSGRETVLVERSEQPREEDGVAARIQRRVSMKFPEEDESEIPSLQRKRPQPVPRMEVVSPIGSAFDMSSLQQAVMETGPSSGHAKTASEADIPQVPYHVRLASRTDENSIEEGISQQIQGQNSRQAQPQVHPIDTSVGGHNPASGYLNHFREPPTLGSPLGGWRRGSRGMTPQSPAGTPPFRIQVQEDIAPMNLVNPRRAASNLGAYNMSYGQEHLHPPSALNSSSRYSLGGDPHLPRNQLRRRKSFESFKKAVPEEVACETGNVKAKDVTPAQAVPDKPSIEIIRAKTQETTEASYINEPHIQATSRTNKPQYSRRARRRSTSRGPRIRRIRSRSHFRNTSRTRGGIERPISPANDKGVEE
ncbi:hypothetical protein KEM56_004558 [Ascosphaera pollenicola]|nr:hypothetical protein KEM56_004558 [Ascosphaera pollenicola]